LGTPISAFLTIAPLSFWSIASGAHFINCGHFHTITERNCLVRKKLANYGKIHGYIFFHALKYILYMQKNCVFTWAITGAQYHGIDIQCPWLSPKQLIFDLQGLVVFPPGMPLLVELLCILNLHGFCWIDPRVGSDYCSWLRDPLYHFENSA
jgi:hypothetical protein